MNTTIFFNKSVKRSVAFFSLLTFLGTQLSPFLVREAHAQSAFYLPSPGVMVGLTTGFLPPVLKGMSVDPQQPFQFDFIFDSGHDDLKEDQIKEEAQRLIRYFLASLTMPEDDLWVNLSPYEKERIIPAEFGKTEMGRDLLAQDYLLKQLTASLIYPEEDLGKEFWERVNAKASQLYGTIEVPVNTFNKVWIVPDKAIVYEENGTVFVLESRLKVMLEEDYVAVKEDLTSEFRAQSKTNELTKFQTEVMREIIIPEIEREVNDGRQFAKLRQIYHSLILAKWYKERLKTSLLNQAYADQRKISGVDLDDPLIAQKIYEQYLEAFKVGVFDYIKEDYDPASQELIPRKYFSGGLELKVPLEVTRSPSPRQLAGIGSKLMWIKGIYRQPRASADGIFP